MKINNNLISKSNKVIQGTRFRLSERNRTEWKLFCVWNEPPFIKYLTTTFVNKKNRTKFLIKWAIKWKKVPNKIHKSIAHTHTPQSFVHFYNIINFINRHHQSSHVVRILGSAYSFRNFFHFFKSKWTTNENQWMVGWMLNMRTLCYSASPERKNWITKLNNNLMWSGWWGMNIISYFFLCGSNWFAYHRKLKIINRIYVCCMWV